MLTVGQQSAQALTEQFYRWELRGRGWFRWPGPVQLEPPFRHFEGHFLPVTPVVDDGQVASLGSRFASRVTSLFGLAPPPEPEREPDNTEEPTPENTADRSGLVELQLALPADYQPKADIFEQFLFSIGYAREPVAFEVVGSADEQVVQITTGLTDAAAIRGQLKAFFPEAVITVGEEHVRDAFLGGAGQVGLLDFGLEREFMVPLQHFKALAADPLVGICGALDQLREGEAGVFQILLEPVRQPWAPSMLRAVSLSDNRPFFANDPELIPQTRIKVSRPLFAVVIRVAARAESAQRVAELVRSLAGALRPLAHPQGNQLVPLDNEDFDPEEHLSDLVRRESHRSGMLLNSDELVAVAHLPTAAVRARNLRRALQKTRPVPIQLTQSETGVWLGENLHEGLASDVFLPLEARLNHCHILGGTGSGKSTLLALLAVQDMHQGHGIAVIDPHGDLIDALLPHVPPERLDDVILFDPADEEYALAFNPLAAGSNREKELLATDFIAVMRQHTSAWGDQMSSLLGNAVLAFLHNSRLGTLPELRRFLVSTEFRSHVLQTVTSPEVAYYWEHEAALANKSAIGSILVRLDELLRSESLLHILGQQANKLDFAEIMDSGKIFLARLSKGLVGQANAYLLGGLLVSKFYQTTIARQSRQREQRRPYMLLMDEAGELLTSTISEILIGARKYGLGLTLAHQSLRQLTGDDEVYGAVTGSCGTKICFQVGGDDARKMADEFGGFVAADLMNLPKLHAVARVGPRDASFNLETHFLPAAERANEEAYVDLRDRTRSRYGTPKSEIRKELEALREFLPKRKTVDPFSELSARQKREKKERTEPPPASTPEPVTAEQPTPNLAQPAPAEPIPRKLPGQRPKTPSPAPNSKAVAAETETLEAPDTAELRSGKAEAVKNAIIQTAGSWGFDYDTEVKILGGKGRVDVVLTLRNRQLACELSATSTAEQEVAHLLNCLSAGFTEIISVCDATVRRKRIASLLLSRLVPGQEAYFHFLTLHQLQNRIGDLGQAAMKAEGSQSGAKAPPAPVILTREEREETEHRQLAEIAERRARAKAAKAQSN